MSVAYSLMDPTGNVTVLVEDPVPVCDQPAAAARIMAQEPTAEQVGFLSENGDGLALRMAGGEFCGNAAMCAAAWFADRHGMARASVRIRVSGAASPVNVALSAPCGGFRRGSVTMPPVRSVDTVTFPDGRTLPVVRFDGISHVILPQPADAAAEAYASGWCRWLHADALGLMFLSLEERKLTPLVYVPAADTLYWEHSCASGTAAVGAYLARERGTAVAVGLRQPGGVLEITADPEGGLILSGTVKNLGRRTANAGPVRRAEEH